MRIYNSITRETLRFVNKMRKRANAPLLEDLAQGVSGCHNCPIATALRQDDAYPQAWVGCASFGIDAEDKVFFDLPRSAQRFITRFDNLTYSEYRA